MGNFLKKAASVILSGAMLAISALDMPSFISDAGEYSRVSVHDPSIVKLEDGSYYVIGSHLGAGRSTDLMNWTDTANSSAGSTKTTYFNNIYTDLAVPNNWANTSSGYDLSGNLWAPDLIWNDVMQKWCMYLSVNGDNWHSSIVLCTADDIDGPYTYQGTIVYSGFETNPANSANSYKNTDVEKVLGSSPDLSRYLTSAGRWNAEYGTNAIDPCTFYDEGGNLWMVYGSWFGGIYMLELDENTGLRDYNVTYTTQKNVSDAYMGTKVAGGYWASGEGPYIEYMCPPGSNKGYYYLFLSYGYFHPNGGYNMRIYRSTNPNGPYVDEKGNSPIFAKGTDDIGADYGVRLMSNYKWSCNGYSFKAQGHNSALMDDDGKLYVIYHTKFGGLGLFHQIRVHQLIMNEDGWITAAPYEYSGESLSENGHTTEAICGEYEFLVNTLDQGYKPEWSESENNDTAVGLATPVNITLNKNGTVTGDISGTWTVTEGSPYMSITYGGVTYKGAFIVQADESTEMVKKMTFTATGNNMCVWGSKKTAYDLSEDLVDRTSDSKLVYNAPDSELLTSSSRLSGTDLLNGISCFITSRFNGKALDLAGGDTSDGANIQQWTLTGGKHQEWRIRQAPGGDSGNYVIISTMADEDKVMTVNDGNIEISAYTGTDNQLFRLVQKRGSYGIVSKASNDKTGLDVYGWSEENGGNIAEYDYWGGDCQLWNIMPAYPTVNDGAYTIKNVNSSLLLNGSESVNNGSIQQNSGAQTWTVTNIGGGYYSITDPDGNALTVEDGSGDDGKDVYLADYTGDNSQKFSFYANEDGSYSIMSAASGGKSCLDVYGISLDPGANICQWSYWGGDGQRFILEPALTPEPEQVIGDVNDDGEFSVADLVMLERFLLGAEKELTSWQAGDLLEDGVIDTFDLILMRRLLV